MNDFLKHYRTVVVPALQKQFHWTNVHQVPRIEKVILNVGLGHHIKNKKGAEAVLENLTKISGQKAVTTKARKSIANFKIREGMEVGAKTTLRGARMHDFLTKLVHVTIPRFRDFHGLEPKQGFDRQGTYSLGLREHIVFPEIVSADLENVHGLEIVIKTTAKNPVETLALLQALGFPFKKS